MAGVSGGVVYSQVVTEPLYQVAGVVGGFGVDAHSKQLSGADMGHLIVAAFEDEVVVYGFTFGVPSEGLVFDDDFDRVAVKGHMQVRLNSELY